MRVSVREDDAGYLAYYNIRARGADVFIYLDGVEQQSVITADEEEGLIVRHVLDTQGMPQIDPNKADEAWVETVTGVVRIETR